jgi:pimeloyl-ACP methyl ester carboxylesterase
VDNTFSLILATEDAVRVQSGGDGQPVLLLLHGLGATGDVWNGWPPVLSERWPGRWLAPDLPGHGGSEPLPRYSFGDLAASLAGLVGPDDQLTVLGHSLGGVLGLALGSGSFDVTVDAVVGVGIKVTWTDDELAKAKALAERPVSWFATREQAASRYLRVSGLTGLLTPDDAAVHAGLSEQDGRWRLAMDPAAFAVGAPDMHWLLAEARARVILARGEHDPLVSEDQLARLQATRVTLPGLGHNAHVEDPAAVAALLTPGWPR